MILDRGYCSIYSKQNGAAAGNMPAAGLTLKYQSWYGELNFETNPVNPDKQRNTEITARIRILQNRNISTDDMAVLSLTQEPPEDAIRFKIIRVYHGTDEESGDLISDISLREEAAQYDASGLP